MGKNKQQRKAENRKANTAASFEALTECSKKLETLTVQMNKLSAKIASSQRHQRTSELALKHIEESGRPQDRYFTQVGRMFMLEQKSGVIQGLRTTIEQSQKDIPRLSQTLEQFAKLKTEQMNQIQELTGA
jgi:predicted RNase H-like nuclease (RuvC/YqgF family)